MTEPKQCIDCIAEGITTKRKLATKRDGTPVPGPRCATHHRAKNAHRRASAQSTRWMKVYGITDEEYWAIYEFQGGRCYICQRATGVKKRLSVDHDHKTGIVRGLLCTTCNKTILGHLRDDIRALWRAIKYLLRPPAVQVIGERVVPNFVAAPVDADDLTPYGGEHEAL